MKHENRGREIDMKSFQDNNLEDFLYDMGQMPAKLGAFVLHLNGLRNTINNLDENLEADMSHESLIDNELDDAYTIFQDKQAKLIAETIESMSRFNRSIVPKKDTIFSLKYKEDSDKKFLAEVYTYSNREYEEENEYNGAYLLSVETELVGYTPVPVFLNKISINYDSAEPKNGTVELMLNHDSDYEGVTHGYRLVLSNEDFLNNFTVGVEDHQYNPHEDFPPAQIISKDMPVLKGYTLGSFSKSVIS